MAFKGFYPLFARTKRGGLPNFCLRAEGLKNCCQNKGETIMKRFVIEENGELYLVTNYRYVKGKLQINPNGCWKFPFTPAKGKNKV